MMRNKEKLTDELNKLTQNVTPSSEKQSTLSTPNQIKINTSTDSQVLNCLLLQTKQKNVRPSPTSVTESICTPLQTSEKRTNSTTNRTGVITKKVEDCQPNFDSIRKELFSTNTQLLCPFINNSSNSNDQDEPSLNHDENASQNTTNNNNSISPAQEHTEYDNNNYFEMNIDSQDDTMEEAQCIDFIMESSHCINCFRNNIYKPLQLTIVPEDYLNKKKI